MRKHPSPQQRVRPTPYRLRAAICLLRSACSLRSRFRCAEFANGPDISERGARTEASVAGMNVARGASLRIPLFIPGRAGD